MRTSISENRISAPKLRALIDREAARLGFDLVAVTAPTSTPLASKRLAAALADGHHADLDWMTETAARRGDPLTLWPEVRSIVMLAMNYGPDANPLDILAQRARAAISVYAQNRDYHDVIKGRLKELAGKVAAASGADVKVFVDTAPVMEKPLAEAAGLGWQGKHTNLVSRKFGSWLFLGSIFTTAELAPDQPEIDHCGNCRACQDICPTQAFPEPYRLDARRCISYLTIENKGPIPREFRKAVGNRVYGCDDCLAICPWNKFAQEAQEAKLVARDDLRAPHLSDLLVLDDPAFRTLFSGSPVKRIGRDRFIRNVLIAAGNSGDRSLAAYSERLLDDPAPVVRGAAVWALSQLLDRNEFARLAGTRQDPDADVQREWALGSD